MCINVIQIIVLVMFVTDGVTLFLFQSRLSLLDLWSGMIDLSVVKYTPLLIAEALMVVISMGLIFLWVQSKIFKKYQRLLLAIGCIFFAIAFFFTSMFSRTTPILPDNILSSNVKTAIAIILDDTDRKIGNPNIYKSYFDNVEGQNKKPNMIIVFAESLSAIDSQRIGGVNNNLPYFDKIQEQGMTFTNFLANGCTSDTAHVALLQWIEPWKFARQQEDIYTGYRVYTDALPLFMKKNGYQTFFLSTASIEFLNQNIFLSGLWFDTIIGETSFKTQEKYVFDAAPDQALYTKTLQTIKGQKAPYLAILQTISFHKPYDTPYGKSEATALRYTDKSLYYFYQQLKKNWFFDNGLLVIIGDHRKMEPLNENEKESLWLLRYGKSLMTVVGTGIVPGSINKNIIQHTDVFYSIKKLVWAWKVKINKLFNDAFGSSQGRDWWIIFCRYFTNRYGLLTTENSGGKVFDYVSEIHNVAPSIYKYLQAYTDYQQFASGTANDATAPTNKKFVIIAHQGSPNEKPWNSLEWFLLAKKNGADGIEMDVSQTSDQKNVVVHGEMLRETICGGKTKITTHTLEWIQEKCPLKNWEKIITLEEMLTQLSGMFDYYFIEIKAHIPQDIEQQTLAAIQTVKKLGMEDKVIFTSYDKTATYLLGSYRNIHAGRDTYNINELTTLPYFTHEYYLMSKDLIKDTTAQEVGDMGKKLVVYTVDNRNDLEQLYHQGVSMIMTNDVIAMKEYTDKLILEGK